MIPFLHRAAPSTLEENPLWMIVLCDMMTNLMLLFLMLYVSIRSVLKQIEVKPPPVEVPVYDAAGLVDRKAAPGEAFEFSEKALLRPGLGSELSEREVRVRLKEGLLFSTGGSSVRPAASATLDLLAGVLLQMPNRLVVEGHTDDRPISRGRWRTNWELSTARACSVLRELERRGVPARRLIASGCGPLRPAAPNASPEGRAANRRVEIVVLKESGP
jgi:chemotaxis protein MotB